MNAKAEPFDDGCGVTRWRLVAYFDSSAKATAALAAIQALPADSAYTPNPDPFAASPVADDPPERMPYVTPPRDPFQEDDTGEPYTIPGCATGACGMD